MSKIAHKGLANGQREQVKTTNILIFDDNPDDCFLIKDMIEKFMTSEDVNISVAYNFEQAIEACYKSNQEFDACLLDFRLGKRDGIRVLQEFREHGIGMPIIFLTGAGDEEVAVKALHSGAANYFSKRNLEATKLVSAIRAAIREHRSMKNLETWFLD